MICFTFSQHSFLLNISPGIPPERAVWEQDEPSHNFFECIYQDYL